MVEAREPYDCIAKPWAWSVFFLFFIRLFSCAQNNISVFTDGSIRYMIFIIRLFSCAQNNIPVFSPALTDGSIGDMIFFHSFNHPGLIVDLVSDIRKLNLMAMKAKKTGMIILGTNRSKYSGTLKRVVFYFEEGGVLL